MQDMNNMVPPYICFLDFDSSSKFVNVNNYAINQSSWMKVLHFLCMSQIWSSILGKRNMNPSQSLLCA